MTTTLTIAETLTLTQDSPVLSPGGLPTGTSQETRLTVTMDEAGARVQITNGETGYDAILGAAEAQRVAELLDDPRPGAWVLVPAPSPSRGGLIVETVPAGLSIVGRTDRLDTAHLVITSDLAAHLAEYFRQAVSAAAWAPIRDSDGTCRDCGQTAGPFAWGHRGTDAEGSFELCDDCAALDQVQDCPEWEWGPGHRVSRWGIVTTLEEAAHLRIARMIRRRVYCAQRSAHQPVLF